MKSEIQMLQIQGGAYFRTEFECLKVILSWSVENLLGVLLLFKISRNLVECKPFKTSCECILFQKRIHFPKKSSNFN